MKNVLRSVDAIPFRSLGNHSDVMLVALLASLIGCLILPLPGSLIDVALSANIILAVVVFISALFAKNPLALSSFPSVLLITTLFRLSLNVSTTRMILSKGEAGDVVEAFGESVIGGDLLVGVVVFLVVTLVQFLVIAKGSERVAEVAARFTLDAMPGKQMAIDAALRAGSLSDEEADNRRNELGRESQFFGAMDGAMKFIKGDAIAGLIITAINLIAGFIIGVIRFDLGLEEAARTYGVLSAGDGLVSQIPALLITLAAGVLTTRVNPRTPTAGLALTLGKELLANRKVLNVAGVFSLVMALVPGFPALPFVIVGAGLLVTAYLRRVRPAPVADSLVGIKGAVQQPPKADADAQHRETKAQGLDLASVMPVVPPVALELDDALSDALGLSGAAAEQTELVRGLIPSLRNALYLETGVRFPAIRVRSYVDGLPPNTAAIKLREVPLAAVRIEPDVLMVLESRERLESLGIESTEGEHPINGMKVCWINVRYRETVEAAKIMAWTPAAVLLLHLGRELRKHAKTFIGIQETSELLKRLDEVCPALVKETVPKNLTIMQLTDILRRLVDEGVSIRDFKTIMETLAEHAAIENDGVTLTELVRSALSLQIAHAYAGTERRLSVLLLHPEIEDMIRSAIVRTSNGSYLALEPELRKAVMQGLQDALVPVVAKRVRPVLLTHADVRRYVRKLLEEDFGAVAVLSFQELPSDLVIHPLGRVNIPGELSLAA